MPLRVIGTGLGRTGTMSLKIALEQLGLGPCYHMAEVMLDPLERAPGWIRAADGDPDWESVFAGFASTVDYPGCRFWRELTAEYPAAKVVHTVRDPDAWFESTQATIFSLRMRHRMDSMPPELQEFFDKTVRQDFGDLIGDRDFMTAAFRKHNADVERAIPAERLLVYEVAQGWQPLCDFLGVEVPDRPFPRVNSREEISAMMTASAAEQGDDTMDIDRMREMMRQRLDAARGGD
jgi:Sulfotransferase domain